jgi:hypothetical protein
MHLHSPYQLRALVVLLFSISCLLSPTAAQIETLKLEDTDAESHTAPPPAGDPAVDDELFRQAYATLSKEQLKADIGVTGDIDAPPPLSDAAYAQLLDVQETKEKEEVASGVCKHSFTLREWVSLISRHASQTSDDDAATDNSALDLDTVNIWTCEEIIGNIALQNVSVSEINSSLELLRKVVAQDTNGYDAIPADASSLFGTLTTVSSGSIAIVDMPDLANLAQLGLVSLQSVKGQFVISNNAVMDDLSHSGSLVDANEGVLLEKLPLLTTLKGFNSMKRITGPLLIEDMPQLTEIAGFNSLEYVHRIFSIALCPALTSIVGFGKLNMIDGDARVVQCDSLRTLKPGLQNLVQVSSSMEIVANVQLRTLDLPKLLVVNGSLAIVGNANLTTVDLTKLEVVSGNFTTQLCGISHIHGFPALTNIGDNLIFKMNFLPLDGKTSPLSPGGSSAEQRKQDKRKSSEAMAQLFVRGTVAITANKGVVDLGILSQKLHRVHLDVSISDNILLKTVMLPHLRETKGRIHIARNAWLRHYLVGGAIGGGIAIVGNGAKVLPSQASMIGRRPNSACSARPSGCRGSVFFFDNQAVNLGGLCSLRIVIGNISIYGNSNLTNFAGLNKLERVSGSMWIHNNENLQSMVGLSSLEAVRGMIDIEANPKLVTLDGLNALEELHGALFVQRNDALEDISALSRLDASRASSLVLPSGIKCIPQNIYDNMGYLSWMWTRFAPSCQIQVPHIDDVADVDVDADVPVQVNDLQVEPQPEHVEL